MPLSSWGIFLALLFLYFVATKILLRFGEDHMFAQNRVILAKAELVWRIHGVLLGIVKANTGFLRNQTNKLALGIIFLCHIGIILAYLLVFVNDRHKKEPPASGEGQMFGSQVPEIAVEEAFAGIKKLIRVAVAAECGWSIISAITRMIEITIQRAIIGANGRTAMASIIQCRNYR